MPAAPKTDLPHNVILGRQEDEDTVRPDWVPGNAVWANGFWYAGNQKLLDPSLHRVTALEHRAQQVAEAATQQASTTEGLPPGYYRHGGLLYGPDKKIALGLEGGYIDDGSHRPGHAKRRAARIARIQEAAADLQTAIDGLVEAQQFHAEAEARFAKAYEPEEDI